MAPRVEDGLARRLTGISHWDVNVSDLERSVEWYAAVTALRPVARTSADQALPSLGLARGTFEGCLLRDPTQGAGFPGIHLVEWKAPHPVGTPYWSHADVGWYRIVVLVADIAAARERVLAQSARPFAPTTDATVRFDAKGAPVPYRVFAVRDPDGITVEFADAAVAGANVPPKVPATVAHNTGALEASLGFYVETLGLDLIGRMRPPGPIPNVYGPAGGTTRMHGAVLAVPADCRVVFDWLEWADHRRGAIPYPEPNHLGIARCALLVDDIEAAHAALAGSRWHTDGVIRLHAPEEWELGGERGRWTVVGFGDPEGVGFQLIAPSD